MFSNSYILVKMRSRSGALMNRGDLSTEQWERLKLLLPPQKPKTGKPNHGHRQVINGRRVDTKNWGTVARPARTLWEVAKCGNSVLSVAKSQHLEPSLRKPTSRGRQTREARVGGSLRRWQRDSCPPTCGCWKKRGEEDEKLGRSRGGFSTKIHIRCEGKGKPITFLLSPGHRNESIFLEQLMEQGGVKRSLARSSAFTPFTISWRQRLHRSSHTQLLTSSRYPFYYPKTTLMNHVAVRLIVKFIVNATLLNALSTDSSNFDVLLPDMRSLLQIIQP